MWMKRRIVTTPLVAMGEAWTHLGGVPGYWKRWYWRRALVNTGEKGSLQPLKAPHFVKLKFQISRKFKHTNGLNPWYVHILDQKLSQHCLFCSICFEHSVISLHMMPSVNIDEKGNKISMIVPPAAMRIGRKEIPNHFKILTEFLGTISSCLLT